ncbi:MAG TPA: 50S ribosomal protein L10 [Dehalococcoidia bacterium]|nr:50S ribosomal protein L10 [Dehalococcoidia bacterium]
MPTEQKIAEVAELKDKLERSTIVISTMYRGLTVKEIAAFRRKLRDGGLEVRVIKNTLLKIAANQAGKPEVFEIVDGPTALAFGYDDVIEAAKAVTEYAGTAPAAFKLAGGYLDGTILNEAALKDLTKIPPRPVLLAQFMGTMNGPLSNFVALMDGPLQELTLLIQSLLREFPGLIEARARQLESGSA